MMMMMMTHDEKLEEEEEDDDDDGGGDETNICHDVVCVSVIAKNNYWIICSINQIIILLSHSKFIFCCSNVWLLASPSDLTFFRSQPYQTLARHVGYRDPRLQNRHWSIGVRVTCYLAD